MLVHLPVIRWISWGSNARHDYSINNTVFTGNLLRVDVKCSHHTHPHKMVTMSGGGYVVIISLYMHILDHHIAGLQYTIFICQFCLNKIREKKRKRKEKKQTNHPSRVTYVSCTSTNMNAISKNIRILFTPNYTLNILCLRKSIRCKTHIHLSLGTNCLQKVTTVLET